MTDIAQNTNEKQNENLNLKKVAFGSDQLTSLLPKNNGIKITNLIII